MPKTLDNRFRFWYYLYMTMEHKITKAQDQAGRPGYMYRGIFLRRTHAREWLAVGTGICRTFFDRKSAIRTIDENIDAIEQARR